jgi:hypothetical protein
MIGFVLSGHDWICALWSWLDLCSLVMIGFVLSGHDWIRALWSWVDLCCPGWPCAHLIVYDDCIWGDCIWDTGQPLYDPDEEHCAGINALMPSSGDFGCRFVHGRDSSSRKLCDSVAFWCDDNLFDILFSCSFPISIRFICLCTKEILLSLIVLCVCMTQADAESGLITC